MANVTRKGYGQVEPNHLSGIVEGRIYAQLPAARVLTTTSSGKKKIIPIAQLEQGQFVKYDYANGVAQADGDGDFYLVYNEEKLYDERYQSHKDFVLKNEDFTTGNFHSGIGKNEITLDTTPPTTSLSTDGKFIYPRLIGTNVGDVITTNTIHAANTSNTAEVVIGTDDELVVGTYLQPGPATGFLEVLKNGPTIVKSLDGADGMVWKIVNVCRMPDGQPGFKIQRVQ